MSENLNYRFAKPDEIPDVARLVTHSFPGPSRTAAWWQEQLADPVYGGGADTLVVGEDVGPARGGIVAALQIHRLEQWVAGTALPMTGIATVTVSPAYRKRGLAASLLTAALRTAGSRGDVVSALYPFRASFYQHMGYGHAGAVHQYQIAPDCLADSDGRTRVELADSDAGRAEVLAFYMRWVKGQTGQMTRTKRAFDNILDAPDRALFVYRSADAAIEGYALVMYRTDMPRRDRFLDVEELVWTSTAARRGLYGWLSSLGDQWEQVAIRSLPSHHTSDWIRDPRMPVSNAPIWLQWAPAATVMMGPMFRLVNAEAAWARRRINSGPPVSVALQVKDEQLGINDGSWRLDLADGTAALERLKNSAEVNISLDISTLSRLYIGSLSATNAHTAGLLECDRPERLSALDALLAIPEPWTFDRF